MTIDKLPFVPVEAKGYDVLKTGLNVFGTGWFCTIVSLIDR